MIKSHPQLFHRRSTAVPSDLINIVHPPVTNLYLINGLTIDWRGNYLINLRQDLTDDLDFTGVIDIKHM